MSAHTKIRARLSSIGDSAPPSDLSEGSGSETFEIVPEWSLDKSHNTNESLYISSDNELHSLSPDNSGILSDNERAQVESFFAGLGTEVRTLAALLFSRFLFIRRFLRFCSSISSIQWLFWSFANTHTYPIAIRYRIGNLMIQNTISNAVFFREYSHVWLHERIHTHSEWRILIKTNRTKQKQKKKWCDRIYVTQTLSLENFNVAIVTDLQSDGALSAFSRTSASIRHLVTESQWLCHEFTTSEIRYLLLSDFIIGIVLMPRLQRVWKCSRRTLLIAVQSDMAAFVVVLRQSALIA